MPATGFHKSRGRSHWDTVNSQLTPSNSLFLLRTLSSLKSDHFSCLTPFHFSSCHSALVASNKVYTLSSRTKQWPQAKEMGTGDFDKNFHISIFCFYISKKKVRLRGETTQCSIKNIEEWLFHSSTQDNTIFETWIQPKGLCDFG